MEDPEVCKAIYKEIYEINDPSWDNSMYYVGLENFLIVRAPHTPEFIGLTYTQLATGDNKLVSIPNSAVVATQIINYTTTGTRRVDIAVSAGYDCAVNAVLEALKEAGAVPTALDTPAPFAAVKNYGESAIEYVLQIWCKSEDYWTTLFDGNKNVKEVFDARGITMTYPHINVHLDK